MTFHDLLRAIDHSPLYTFALVFYGFYPLSMAVLWVIMATVFFRRREIRPAALAPPDYTPFVSVIVPAFEEEKTIGRTIDALLALDYPDYEIVVVNDGSHDATAAAVRRYLDSGRVRLVDKTMNEGKAMALNDALPACRGEILVCVDSDIVVTPQVLRALIPHFAAPRVGAVTGNPRVANRGSLLRDLQTLEFTSIISVQRRAQRVWGRVLTVSGAIFAIRKTALIETGPFAPDMATEDIDITWKLQRSFWDVRYEPSAVAWMQVPPTLPELWKQRRRWARGLAQVLKRHWRTTLNWKERRLWPIFYEACASITWAYTFVFMSAFWVICHLSGYAPRGGSPIPNLWGMLVATACLTQIFAGGLMDRRYDRHLLHYYAIAIFYPIVYWMLMSLITAIYTIDVFVRRQPELQRWKIRRVAMKLIVPIAAAFLCGSAIAQTPLVEHGDAAAAADRHAEAIAAYEKAIAEDSSLRRDLLPKVGRQYLWADRPRKAAALFEDYLASKPDDCEIRNDYGLALAWSDDVRAAERVYRDVIARCDADAQRHTARVRLAGLQANDRLQVASQGQAFQDADGTRFGQAALALRRGGGAIVAGTFDLRDDRTSMDGRWLELRGEHRFTTAHAIRASMRRTTMTSLDWQPLSAEVDFVFTPSDGLRADFSAARLLLDDNVAAVVHHLRGDFVSAGADWRVSLRTTITAAADHTRWSTDNTRWRIRLNAIHTFETTPRITLEWPLLVQLYDQPFPFALFSPRRYYEAGPAMNIRWKPARWGISFYGRAGAQRETNQSWKALATIRAAAERDLAGPWLLRAAAGWSNSNLAGSGGFRRSSVSLEAVRRF